MDIFAKFLSGPNTHGVRYDTRFLLTQLLPPQRDPTIVTRLRAAAEYFRITKKGKSGPYSITERRVPELIPVLGSQPACDVSHKPGGRLPLYFPSGMQLPKQPLREVLPILLLGEQRHNGCEQFA